MPGEQPGVFVGLPERAGWNGAGGSVAGAEACAGAPEAGPEAEEVMIQRQKVLAICVILFLPMQPYTLR